MKQEDIEEKANELTKVYSEPPIPVYEIIREAGLQVYEADFGDAHTRFSGFIDFKTKGIYLNQDDTKTRNRFTAAHELGHWILHRNLFEADPSKYNFLLRGKNTDNNDPEEQEADYFATCLLVPRSLLSPLRENSAKILACAFGVSRSMMEIRLKRV